jgi:hypothetical protein
LLIIQAGEWRWRDMSTARIVVPSPLAGEGFAGGATCTVR